MRENQVRIKDNIFTVAPIVTLKAGKLDVYRNTGYVTENSGTAAIGAGQTAIVVGHGLASAPTRIQLTPTNKPTNAVGWYWVSALTPTQFTIHVDADPGASGVTFDWRAVTGEGK
ncbi:MAG: hypothetical protein HY681_03235 [Chloroflexi bacterium]|nr:hypothetical protein [Chloroflexota bacterium]